MGLILSERNTGKGARFVNSPVPFLKWAGGKRWLVQILKHNLPLMQGKYIEPFLGSGAIYFYLKPEKALLSDLNPCLIDTYSSIKNNWKEVFSMLEDHHRLHSSSYYYKIREEIPKTKVERAARFIYLNRTCWNGLYRVNKQGKFNAPVGTKQSVVLDTDDFSAISIMLQKADIQKSDFETIINQAEAGDLIFADPPYTVKHNANGFIKYNETLFSWDDQIRLRDSLLRAKKRGVNVLATNAYHESLISLYETNFKLERVERATVLAANPKKRGRCEELLIRG